MPLCGQRSQAAGDGHLRLRRRRRERSSWSVIAERWYRADRLMGADSKAGLPGGSLRDELGLARRAPGPLPSAWPGGSVVARYLLSHPVAIDDDLEEGASLTRLLLALTWYLDHFWRPWQARPDRHTPNPRGAAPSRLVQGTRARALCWTSSPASLEPLGDQLGRVDLRRDADALKEGAT